MEKDQHSATAKPLSPNASSKKDNFPFTLKDLRDAIPDHCFERNTLYSLWYLLLNLTLVIMFIYIGILLVLHEPDSLILRSLIWISYSVVQGTFFTGLWVIGHECGHRAFSASNTVNDLVGLIVHSLLLVPFHSWRITHANHHKNNINLENDSVFVPKKKRVYISSHRV